MPARNKILVVGSIAYDNLMRFDGLFKDVIVRGKHGFSVTVAERDLSYGGCGGNISYGLKLLGESPLPVSAAGRDFSEYKARLKGLKIETRFIGTSKKHHTAAAFICTDKHENQVTFFDAGAMGAVSETAALKNLKNSGAALAIISPDNPVRMLQSARECRKLRIPFVFDPGQQIPFFMPADLKWAVKSCDLLIVNDYEALLLARTLGISKAKLSMTVPVYIETLGAKGCAINSRKEGAFSVPAVKPAKILDPTGCGDAFRAGLLSGLARKLPMRKCAQAGALLAAYKLEGPGTQNYRFTRGQFNKRYKAVYGDSFF